MGLIYLMCKKNKNKKGKEKKGEVIFECLVPESQQEASEKVRPIQFPEELI